MLSKKDFIFCMQKIQKDQKYLKEFIKNIGKYFDDVYIFDLGDQLLYTQIEILKIAMDDENNSWIDWYIYDNNWGNEKLEAGYGIIKPIKTINDLYRLFQEMQKNN